MISAPLLKITIFLFFFGIFSSASASNERCTDTAVHYRDNFKIALTATDVKLKLPIHSRIIAHRFQPNCGRVRGVFIKYIWSEGDLFPSLSPIPIPSHRFRKSLSITISIEDSGALEKYMSYLADEDAWRYESPLKHKFYPLEHYPKFYGETGSSPEPDSEAIKNSSTHWGFTGIEAKHPDGRTFTANCSIPAKTENEENSLLSNKFSRFGLGGCRGYYVVYNNEKYFSGTFIIKPSSIEGYKNLDKINLAFDAVHREMTNYIMDVHKQP